MIKKKTIDDVFQQEQDSWYRFAFGMLGNKEDAMDVLHDAYEKMRKRAMETTLSSIKGYLFLIIRNLCFDELNRRSKNMMINVEEISIGYESNALEVVDEIKILNQFLKKLPTTQRSVILLKDIEGYSYDEVSEMLEMDKNNIRVNLSQARKKIRNAFAHLRDQELKTKK